MFSSLQTGLLKREITWAGPRGRENNEFGRYEKTHRMEKTRHIKQYQPQENSTDKDDFPSKPRRNNTQKHNENTNW